MRTEIDVEHLADLLRAFMQIHSPTGMTDDLARAVAQALDDVGVSWRWTRRGSLKATIPGAGGGPVRRAIVVHLDTLGAMIRGVDDDGRLLLAPIGTWSARWAEGARVTAWSPYSEAPPIRGSVLPTRASGHVYGDAIDTDPIAWDHLRLRLDAPVKGPEDVAALGLGVGDFVGFDPGLEIDDSGYIIARHLDDKAGIAAVLAGARAALGGPLTEGCHLIFTASEEVGTGSPGALDDEIEEMIAIDIAPQAPGQTSDEHEVSLCMLDASGPFDVHLCRHLIELAKAETLPLRRDTFRYYRSDAAAAAEAGWDVRTALLAFGTDATHGYERTHIDSLVDLAALLAAYLASPFSPPRR